MSIKKLIELIKELVMILIETVKVFISNIVKTYCGSPDPENTKTYVTQQLFRQNTIQVYNEAYYSQTPFNVPNDLFGPLTEIIPIVQPLMEISSIGSLITNFVQMPQPIVELINLIGSGAVLSIIFEVINLIITQVIQALFNQLIAPIIPDLLNVFSIQSSFSTDEITYLEAVLDGGTVNPGINFDDLYNKIIFLPFQIFETIKGISVISNAFGLLINGTIDLLSGVIGFIQVLNSAIDIDLFLSFAFQLLSRLFFSYATYITYPPGLINNPSSPSDYTSNNHVLIGELGLDVLGIASSFISWIFASRLNNRYPDGRFGQVSTYAITFLGINTGELLEDLAKFIIYGVNPIDSQSIKLISTFGGIFYWLGNLLKILSFFSYVYGTIRDKLSRISEMTLPEMIGTLSTLGNTVISAINSWLSFKSGRDYANKVQTASGGLNDFFNWALTKDTDPISFTTFSVAKLVLSNQPPNFLNPIVPLDSFDKKDFLGLTAIQFCLDITLYLSQL